MFELKTRRWPTTPRRTPRRQVHPTPSPDALGRLPSPSPLSLFVDTSAHSGPDLPLGCRLVLLLTIGCKIHGYLAIQIIAQAGSAATEAPKSVPPRLLRIHWGFKIAAPRLLQSHGGFIFTAPRLLKNNSGLKTSGQGGSKITHE